MRFIIILLLALFHCHFTALADPVSNKFSPEIRAFLASDQTNPPPAHAILFIGSSSIRMWKSLAADFPSRHVINRGFGGSEISDSLFFAPQIVLPYQPDVIVFYAGGNDLNSGKSPEKVLADFRSFNTFVRQHLPQTHLVYISIAPNPARWSQIEKIRASNALIAEELAGQPHRSFLNVFSSMLGSDDLPLPDIYLPDRLHMNERGYAIWKKLVNAHLDQVLQSTTASAP